MFESGAERNWLCAIHSARSPCEQCMGGLQVPAGPQSSSRAGNGFERLYSALGDFGDHQLVLAGLQENFPAARYLDSHMARTAAVANALAEGDRLLRAVHRRSDFAALKFAPAHALAVRAIVAGPQRCALHEALAAQGKLQAHWKVHLQIMEYKRVIPEVSAPQSHSRGSTGQTASILKLRFGVQ